MDTAGSPGQGLSARSSRGCWTCRLRRKKCDEVRPGCLRCASVDLECHYGARPRWIDDIVLGKQELERIKPIVGASASRKRAVRRKKQLGRGTPGASSTQEIVQSDPVPPVSDQSARLAENIVGHLEVGAPDDCHLGPHPASDHASQSPSPLHHTRPRWVGDDEASLIMHYLDHVFFIQFRFHVPAPSAGGRGWLLSLLTTTKPLYHATLSLSAFHQQSLLWRDDEGGGGQSQIDYLEELERHHLLTLQELQLSIQAHCEDGGGRRLFGGNVNILACMVQLISFELFNGGASNWQVHLRAASGLVLQLHGIRETYRPLDFRDIPLSSQIPPDSPRPSSLLSPGDAALNFLTAAIIWFDVIACVSTGSPTFLSKYHGILLASSSADSSSTGPLTAKIELHTIMGCQNWVMASIDQIAQLKAWREEETSTGHITFQSICARATEIKSQLDLQCASIAHELHSLRQRHAGPPPPHFPELYNKHTELVVTQLFALTAFIYLETAVSSDPSVLAVHAPLQRCIAAMRLVPDPRMFRGLLWPLCVAGCMASSTADRQVFRAAAEGAIADSRRFGTSARALEILEMSWELQRRRGRLVDCTTAIRELGTCVLLV